MNTLRRMTSLALLIGFCGIGLSSVAQAAKFTAAEQLTAQKRFLRLVVERDFFHQPLVNIPLDPRLVAQWNHTYSAAEKKYGAILPPLLKQSNGLYPATFNFDQVFRQNFGFVLLEKRALLRPNGGAARLLKNHGFVLDPTPAPPPFLHSKAGNVKTSFTSEQEITGSGSSAAQASSRAQSNMNNLFKKLNKFLSLIGLDIEHIDDFDTTEVTTIVSGKPPKTTQVITVHKHYHNKLSFHAGI